MSSEILESGRAGLTGGEMSWEDAVAGPLSGATCLWQDLAGLHTEAAPGEAPCTSILWGWRDDELIRVRLDGNRAFVAVLSPTAASGTVRAEAVAWDPSDGRIASLRGPAVAPGVGPGKFEQFVLGGDGDGTGAITFIRPVQAGGAGE